MKLNFDMALEFTKIEYLKKVHLELEFIKLEFLVFPVFQTLSQPLLEANEGKKIDRS